MIKRVLRGLFVAFPNGLPGLILLELRVVLGSALLILAWLCLSLPNPSSRTWIAGIIAAIASIFLLIGLVTPIAGAAAGLAGFDIGFSRHPAGTFVWFHSPLVVVFGAAILVSIVVLGPGAYSVDARLFGRRTIIIPASSRLQP